LTDAAVIRERRRERVANAERSMFTFFRSMIIFFFGAPLLVVFLYHLLGWKAAVSVFPLLLAAARLYRSAKRERESPASGKRPERFLFWTVIFLIPMISIASAEPEIMRLWALAAGFMLSAGIVEMWPKLEAEKISAGAAASNYSVARFLGYAAPGMLFVAGSEIIWQLTTFGVWVWYHAFFLHVFVGCAFLVFWLADVGKLRTGPQGNTVLEVKPPRARSKKQGERHSVSLASGDKTWLEYRDITLGQACRLFEGLEQDLSQLPHTQDSQTPGGKTWRTFSVDFGGSTRLGLTNAASEDQDMHEIEWQHMVPRRQGVGLTSPLKVVRAKYVPSALIPELLELGWEEDWDGLAALLTPFADAGVASR
jgi:hypothetical protein